jgi:hypothetical protein
MGEEVGPPGESGTAVQILYPLAGDRFVGDSSMGCQTIRLRARVLEPVGAIAWYVDGVQYAEAAPPYDCSWELKRGAHRIAASAGGIAGDEIEVYVE